MTEGGEREAWLTADYNAEMVEQIARYPRLRDRSIYIGNRDDLVPDPLGPGLPTIREWTEAHFGFPGYVSGTSAYTDQEREQLRQRFGYRDDQVTCIVTAGGTAVGTTLLNRVLEAFPYAAKQLADLRMVVVAGPRVDRDLLTVPAGNVEVRGYLPHLDQHLAACDIAVVQGGLTTAMELTANRRPFLYFPLANHFEQQRHVAHRLDRYRAGRPMQLAQVTRGHRRRARRRARATAGLPAGRERRRPARGRDARRVAVKGHREGQPSATMSTTAATAPRTTTRRKR